MSASRLSDVDLLAELLDGDVRVVERLHLRDQALEVPFLRVLGVGELRHRRRDGLLDPLAHLVREVVALEHAVGAARR